MKSEFFTGDYIGAARKLLEASRDPLAAKADSILAKGSDQIQRAAQIIRRLRDFVEKRKVSRNTEDINLVIRDAIALGLVAASDVNVKLETRLTPNLPDISLDRVQIQQVLVNLIRNAIEAMEASATKEIVVSALEKEVVVEVSVADSGPGIAPDVAERLFQPFVSTKSTGMGIGLSICRSIIDAHGGMLWMTPRPGGGTVFRFELPIGRDDDDDE